MKSRNTDWASLTPWISGEVRVCSTPLRDAARRRLTRLPGRSRMAAWHIGMPSNIHHIPCKAVAARPRQPPVRGIWRGMLPLLRSAHWPVMTAVLVLPAVLASMVVAVFGGPLGRPAEAAGEPVLVGAGDIADCGQSGDEATADLLDGIRGTVFTAGDNAYESGTAAQLPSATTPAGAATRTGRGPSRATTTTARRDPRATSGRPRATRREATTPTTSAGGT